MDVRLFEFFNFHTRMESITDRYDKWLAGSRSVFASLSVVGVPPGNDLLRRESRQIVRTFFFFCKSVVAISKSK